jgi:Tol biopolymer transport system component
MNRPSRPQWMGAMLVVGGLVMSLTAVQASRLPEEMPGEQVVFAEGSLDEDGETRYALFTIAVDGTDRQRLVEPTEWRITRPAWSPDGRTIFYHQDSETEVFGALVDHDGSVHGVEGGCIGASWSPDAREFVCEMSDAGAGGEGSELLMVHRADGTKIRDIPNTSVGLRPQWSPDGQLIAYISGAGAQPALHVVRPDGSGRRLIAHNTRTFGWGPDGRQLLFFRDGGWRLVDRDGSNVRVLGHQAGRWSPDGNWFAYTQPNSQTGHDEIWVIRTDGSGARRVAGAPEQNHRQPVWSPSGQRLAFLATSGEMGSSGDVWVVDAHRVGAAPRRLTDSGQARDPGFAPGKALRAFGPDRIHTAVDVSRRMRDSETRFPIAVIARADDYADALAGGPLAVLADGPLLLTTRDRLHPATAAEIRRIGAARAYLLGSDAALSPRVEQDLRAAGVAVTRLGGANRFATARLVAAEMEALGGNRISTAYVVEGANSDPRRGWPDAVAAGGLAASERRPILPVLRDRLPADTAAAIDRLGLDHAVIVGGTTAVSAEVADAIAERDVVVDRIAGADRYATAMQVADRAVAAGMSAQRPWIATGCNWPDALAVGPAAAADGGVLLLIDGVDPGRSTATSGWLDTHDCCYERIVLTGGPGAISPRAATHVEKHALP